MNTLFKRSLASILIFLPTCVLAQNYGFLSNSAMSYFTKEDWQIFNNTQNDVLSHGKNGVKVLWKNPRSGNHGYMIPASASPQNGMTCRFISFYNTANQINGEGTYKFCKLNNTWKIY